MTGKGHEAKAAGLMPAVCWGSGLAVRSLSREWPLSADTVEEVGSCRRLAGLIQSGPGDRSGSDDGRTRRPAGRCRATIRVRGRLPTQIPALQDALFYEFSLERHVPESHLLR